jgi:hypothetical protein
MTAIGGLILGFSTLAALVLTISMHYWPKPTAIIMVGGLVIITFWGWWTDPATFDTPPPYEHCSGGRCSYDRDMMERMR